MLNRKDSKAGKNRRGRERVAPHKERPVRRRFIIGKAANAKMRSEESRNGHSKKSSQGVQNNLPLAAATPVDLTEPIKTLLHINQEHGYVTYDDINDVLPDGLTPDDLDTLYTKLRTLEVEIVDQAEVERAKPAEPEEEEDARLEILDDPVRMYMNQMGKVPLLTREQEVEICKRIEDAEIEMKRLVYG